MSQRPIKASKRDIRREQHLTRPPRMEGKAKNAGVNPIRKKKVPRKERRGL